MLAKILKLSTKTLKLFPMIHQLSHRRHPLHPSSIRDVRSLLRIRFLKSLNDLHVLSFLSSLLHKMGPKMDLNIEGNAYQNRERVESFYVQETRRKKRGGIGRERGNACKRSQKVDRSGILDSSVPSYWSIMTRLLLTLKCL